MLTEAQHKEVDEMTDKMMAMKETDPERYQLIMKGIMDELEIAALKKHIHDMEMARQEYKARLEYVHASLDPIRRRLNG